MDEGGSVDGGEGKRTMEEASKHATKVSTEWVRVFS